MHFVYVLENRYNRYYIGYTSNLIRRLQEHKNQRDFSYQLVYYEAYLSEKTARKREIKLKYYGSAWRALKKRISA